MLGDRGASRARLEVYHHLLAATAEEMGVRLMRSSFSPNIRERRDYSCAIFDGRGQLVGQASHLPVHLGATPLSVAAAIDAVDMQRGDAVLLNDPYAGGTHLPDLTLVSPVFLGKSRRPDFYCANRAHHADAGGAAPGSMAASLDVHGEGLRIPPVKLVSGGELQNDVLELILANMRVRREREGDLLAQWAANRLGAQRLENLAQEQGRKQLQRRAGELLDWSEDLTEDLIARLPAKKFSFSDRLQVGPDESALLAVTIQRRVVRGSKRLVFDFTGCDRRPGSSLNATRAVTLSAVLYVLRLLLPDGTPTNGGVLRPVDVRTTPGSLVDARYPSSVAAGNVETSQRLVDVLLGAFAEVLPDVIPAASAGTMSNLTFGGHFEEGPAVGEEFVHYETHGGGAGASPAGPGASAVQTHMTNTRNTPLEELERQLPLKVLSLAVRRGSGGSGLHSGGEGIVKRFALRSACHVSWVASRQAQGSDDSVGRGPWGLAGGGAGQPGRARWRSGPRARWKVLESGSSLDLPAGAELEIETPGGGGWGRA